MSRLVGTTRPIAAIDYAQASAFPARPGHGAVSCWAREARGARARRTKSLPAFCARIVRVIARGDSQSQDRGRHSSQLRQHPSARHRSRRRLRQRHERRRGRHQRSARRQSASPQRSPAGVQPIQLGDWAVNIGVRPWVLVPDYVAASGEINGAILESFRHRGIIMPFPQREVKLIGNTP